MGMPDITYRIRGLFLACLVLLVQPPALATDFRQLDDLSPASPEDYRTPGQWLIVVMWASDCPVCNQEAHAYQDFHFAHSDHDASVLGISLDGSARLEEARAFVSRHAVEYPNLIGEPALVAEFYMAATGTPWVGTPSFLVYGPEGELAAKQAGAVSMEIIERFIASRSGSSI